MEITAIANKPGHCEKYIIVSIAPITILSQPLFEAHCLFYFLEAIIFNVINLYKEIFQFADRETDVTFDISGFLNHCGLCIATLRFPCLELNRKVWLFKNLFKW